VALENERFYFKKIKNKKYKYKGIILNYENEIKNKLMAIASIDYISLTEKYIFNKYKKYNDKKTNQFIITQLNTKCNLIITDFRKINQWTNIINKNILIIEFKK
jgi:hypothetical protein